MWTKCFIVSNRINRIEGLGQVNNNRFVFSLWCAVFGTVRWPSRAGSGESFSS